MYSFTLINMSIIFILIGVSLFVALAFLVLFVWAVKSGQFDDDYTPSVRMLFEEKKIKKTEETDIFEVEDNRINNLNTNKN